MDTSLILVGVGAIAFIGYLVWLIVRIVSWDSKIPPIIGMLLCMVMVVCGISGMEGTENLINPNAEGKSQENQNTVKETQKEIQSENNAEKISTNKKFEAKSVLSQMEVTELSFDTDYWHYAVLLIKNNSKYNVSVSARVKFYDTDGNLVAAKNTSEDAIESGYYAVLTFMPDEAFETMEYELDVSEEKWYECIQSDMAYEAVEAKNKVILSITNNGNEAADFVTGHVLFYKGDKLVYYSENYFTDDDSEIKPGKTISKEMDCYRDFDSYQVFIMGRR